MRLCFELFAAAREAAGKSEVEVECGAATLAAARAALAAAEPALAAILPACRFAREDRYLSEDAELSDGDRIAVIPPVAGGTDGAARAAAGTVVFAEVVAAPLDVAAVLSRAARPEAGAVVLFVGVVRNETRGRPVEALEYEAHPTMAPAVLREIAQAAAARFSLLAAGVAHRVGRLVPGTPSVVIATAAAHRAPAYEANRWILEALKKDAPIWKKEWREGAEGGEWVKGGG